MRPNERRDWVLREVLSGNGRVDQLSAELGVSESTIRRDLQRLVDEGRVTRTYGGAVASSRTELSLGEKAQALREEKRAIGAAAAAEVESGETVLLDAGSTTGALAWELRNREDLTIYANGLNAVITLYEHESVRIIVIGGRLRTTTGSMVGPLAAESLKHVYADRAFLGANGLTVEHGISSATDAQSRVKTLMAERARRLYVLADHTKLGVLPFPSLAPLNRDYTIITSEGNAEGRADFEDARHIDVLVVRDEERTVARTPSTQSVQPVLAAKAGPPQGRAS